MTVPASSSNLRQITNVPSNLFQMVNVPLNLQQNQSTQCKCLLNPCTLVIMKHSALQSSARLSPSLPECRRNDPAICLGEDEGISRVSGPRVNLWWSHTSIHVMGESNVCTYMHMVYIPCTWYGHCLSPATSCIVLTISCSACSIWSQMLFVTHAASVMIGLLPP